MPHQVVWVTGLGTLAALKILQKTFDLERSTFDRTKKIFQIIIWRRICSDHIWRGKKTFDQVGHTQDSYL